MKLQAKRHCDLKFRETPNAQSHFCNLSSDTTDFMQLCITTGCLTDLVFNIKINLFILFSILATIKPIISIIIYHPMSFDVRLPKDVELLSGPIAMRQYKEVFFVTKGI